MMTDKWEDTTEFETLEEAYEALSKVYNTFSALGVDLLKQDTLNAVFGAITVADKYMRMMGE
jgi:hypothetical protein